MRPLLLAPLLVVSFACAPSAPVRLDVYRGVYSTHFEGIPDQGRICAVLHNPQPRAVDWVRLRLRSKSSLGGKPGRWTSTWVYEGRIEPGESAFIELENPPVSDEIELEVKRWGRGPLKRQGRPTRPVETCSGQALRAGIEADRNGARVGLRIESMRQPASSASAGVIVATDD